MNPFYESQWEKASIGRDHNVLPSDALPWVPDQAWVQRTPNTCPHGGSHESEWKSATEKKVRTPQLPITVADRRKQLVIFSLLPRRVSLRRRIPLNSHHQPSHACRETSRVLNRSVVEFRCLLCLMLLLQTSVSTLALFQGCSPWLYPCLHH